MDPAAAASMEDLEGYTARGTGGETNGGPGKIMGTSCFFQQFLDVFVRDGGWNDLNDVHGFWMILVPYKSLNR